MTSPTITSSTTIFPYSITTILSKIENKFCQFKNYHYFCRENMR